MGQCSELKRVSKTEMTGIRAMQHGLDVSEADIDYVVGKCSLLSTPLHLGHKIWGIAGNDANAAYSNWGHLLRAAALQTLSQRLGIVQTVGKLSAHLGASQDIGVKIMGPSGHTAYLVKVLKAGLGMPTRHVSVDNDLTAQSSSEGVREGAIAIIGMDRTVRTSIVFEKLSKQAKIVTKRFRLIVFP